ncbi:NAD(P)H-dependent amine dehydrogenase family protein [Alteriqipengyuania lutimaris]|uniref:Dihydrodipicolinate reductase n=1 Tax=Alteriqipengyuania lutimaris TaxID=1538146 RepID=A0A395LKI6_9SPHN|nr:dihydrodipicolinate reductase [Alteriqipengyuania lutimaris]MBB3033703.1 hypothetical protein [Alteriqipengyuania lutimaris]RDS77311.1 dihydrodipicolinate reductase [Alteriqipengyuania lutimaris]
MTRVIQWATGSMGRTGLRRIIDAQGLTLAGAYVYGSKKAGTDAGLLAKREKTGVLATSDRDEILALDADVVLHCPRITQPYDALVDDVVALLESGKNVVSIAGFHWPDAHGAGYASRLREAAMRGGVTLAGVGVNPGMVVERLALAASAMSHELDRISVFETVDASGMASPEFVFGLMGLDSDPAAKDIREGPLADLYGTLFSEVLHFFAAEMGGKVTEIVPDHRLTLAEKDIETAAGPIRPGHVAATEWRWTAKTDLGPELLLSILWTADPSLHGDDRQGHWTLRLDGRPVIRMTLDIEEGDPSKPPSRALTDATIAVAINAIPHVVAAPPGLFAFHPPAAWSAA